MADRIVITDDDVVIEEPLVESEVVYICARCEMEIAGEPVWRAGEVYCCQGCALGTGCTCTRA
jgi:hypothetical protein